MLGIQVTLLVHNLKQTVQLCHILYIKI